MIQGELTREQYNKWIEDQLFKEIFKPTNSKTKWAIMLPETWKQLKGIGMDEKRSGKKC